VFLRFGVHLARCGVATFSALFVYLSSFCQRTAGDVLRRILGPSLETGTIFDAVLSVNYCAICDLVSVRAVQEKCDEKGGGVRFGKAHEGDGGGIPPFSQSARKGWSTRRWALPWPRVSYWITMPPSVPFWAEAWKKLRPEAISFVIEVGLYVKIWLMVLVAHVAKILMAGMEPDVVNFVGWMEKWLFLASFTSLFARLLLRLYRQIVRSGAL